MESESVSTNSFNPRAPRGARRAATSLSSSTRVFQSTRPARGATRTIHWIFSTIGFNPRAPRGARLTAQPTQTSGSPGFQSTRPARGATKELLAILEDAWFQSTRPARGATPTSSACGRMRSVSIHAPRAGRDGQTQRGGTTTPCFNPRAPRGARPGNSGACRAWTRFNPRAPRGARRGE